MTKLVPDYWFLLVFKMLNSKNHLVSSIEIVLFYWTLQSLIQTSISCKNNLEFVYHIVMRPEEQS